ncbi:septum formation family protein [Saccharopolyspora cebuensis]|uniref:Septum formation family protein n=1 Tax=Saccharopolyspora cebuensis TaxID=418759 RepID=A0ABV4CHZ9_9PSEU
MAESAPPPHQRRKKPDTRLVMISAALGALLILVVSALLNWPTGGGGGGSNRFGANPAPPAVFDATAGTCLTWRSADASDIGKIGCERPHLFEVTGKADLAAQFPPNAPYPPTEQWQQLKMDHCTQVARNFLGGRFDPNGKFGVGAFTPSEESWQRGDRTLFCGLQQPGPSGRLHPITGDAARIDQSNTWPVGTCLGINGTEPWDPVDCAQPHSLEITGLVNLAEQFPEGYPPVEEQDGFLATRCEEITAEYAGSPTAARDKGLVVSWDTLAQESWDAGSREVNCKVGATLPDGSGLAPVTGSVKGEVQVGTEPAPVDPTPPQPGAPATEPR